MNILPSIEKTIQKKTMWSLRSTAMFLKLQRLLPQFQIVVVIAMTLCMTSVVTALTTTPLISKPTTSFPISYQRKYFTRHCSTTNTDGGTNTEQPSQPPQPPQQELPPDFGMGAPYDDDLKYMGISQELDELDVGESLFKTVKFDLRTKEIPLELKEEEEEESGAGGGKTIEIRKLSQKPPLFLLKNILSEEDCDYLHTISDENDAIRWEKADTNRGETDSINFRIKSKVAWVSNLLRPGFATLARSVQSIFLPYEPFDVFRRDANGSGSGSGIGIGNRCVEELQLVTYEPKGEYRVHHDSARRLVTCLYYVNGVSETFFPLADYGRRMRGYGEAMYVATRICRDMEKDGDDVGRRRGVLVSSDPKSTTRVEKGDAIVFYNYFQDASMEWNALHAGLPAPSTKFIATHWYHHVPRR